MSIDLVGSWDGTFSTGDDWVYPGLTDLHGNPVEQSGAPTRTYDVTLEIEWQGNFEQFLQGGGFTASPFYGVLIGDDPNSGGHRIPVSGFMNKDGYISFSFYNDEQPPTPGAIYVAGYCNFESFIKTHQAVHSMSGEWLMTAWQDHLISYKYGNLSVKRKVSLKERAQVILSSLVRLFK